MMNSFLCVVLSFAFLFTGVPASADEYEPEIYITQNYALAEPEKDINITTTTATYTVGSMIGGSSSDYFQNGPLVYGAVVTGIQSNENGFYPKCDILLANSEGVLFDQPGLIQLRMVARCKELQIMFCKRDGTSDYIILDPSLFLNYEVDYYLDNYDANIYMIRVTYSLSPSNTSGDYFSASLQYGYKIKEPSVFELISNFFGNYFIKFVNAATSALDSFFTDIKNANIFKSSSSNLESTQNTLLESVGSVDQIQFDVQVLDEEPLLVTFSWLSTILLGLYSNVKFSVIFNITCALFIASICLGFVRHWKGGK